MITPKQKEFLQLIVDGWEIGMGTGFTPRAWIQKGGLGRGGEARDIHFNTFSAMRLKGLIELNEQHQFADPQRYHITEKSKLALNP